MLASHTLQFCHRAKQACGPESGVDVKEAAPKDRLLCVNMLDVGFEYFGEIVTGLFGARPQDQSVVFCCSVFRHVSLI